jgi:hypothetical protein
VTFLCAPISFPMKNIGVQGVPPRLPTAGQNDPQPGLTDRRKDVAPESTREDPDLVPKREVLQRELTLRSKG